MQAQLLGPDEVHGGLAARSQQLRRYETPSKNPMKTVEDLRPRSTIFSGLPGHLGTPCRDGPRRFVQCGSIQLRHGGRNVTAAKVCPISGRTAGTIKAEISTGPVHGASTGSTGVGGVGCRLGASSLRRPCSWWHRLSTTSQAQGALCEIPLLS